MTLEIKLPEPASVLTTSSVVSEQQSQAPEGTENNNTEVTSEGFTQPQTAGEVQSNVQQTAVSTTKAPETQKNPSSMTTDEILAAVKSAINDMKNYNGSFAAVQNKVVTLNITDCSLPGMTSVVNNVVQKLAGDSKTVSFNFVNGSASDEKGNPTTATAEVPPRTKLFTLTKDGVVSAKAEKSGVNTVYTIVIKAETADYNNMYPTYHGAAMGFLNLAGMDISPAKITKADMQYSGGTLTATVSPEGKLLVLRDYLPMSGTGGGSLGVLSAEATFNGALDETWTFTW